jgi:hypothetical protein
LTELLSESESTVERLLQQEAVLKEEFRKIERVEKRQNINIE